MQNPFFSPRPCLAVLGFGLQLVCLPGVAGETSSESWAGQSAQESAFRQLDRNGDGFISQSEAARDTVLQQGFPQFDENHDRRLSADEFSRARLAIERQRISDYAADSLVTARIKAALLRDSQISALSISVETAHGQVILSGFVEDERQVSRIRRLVEGVEGVKKVRDLLVVKG